ncbi:MAG: tRNA preQ1(34) S-adenosylmethionine ribosyltransferase-isomerase QueA [Candidatus Thermoplasmatota archaeon]|nr:tRNA preQ1(34) S-adenosylmethionine ribosyltransferase-isomerase QueA [Candidatus Thermoplasmatota archaeon]MDI6887638.1 tRNA preQ1(34) S-adenosylmethionine ribosyltransferase-isomerase QueA [Candidatus Thermoplasmatota archaeon]
MKLSEFDYYLPKELIAQVPVEPRDNSKLMVIRREKTKHRIFYDIVDELDSGDTLVLNDTKVIPAKLVGKKTTGGKVELLILDKLNSNKYKALVKGKKIRAGLEIGFENCIVGRVEKQIAEGEFVIELNRKLDLAKIGRMPLPPYIKKELNDQSRYNTVYAKHEGSVAAPTSGLHFTKELLKRIEKKCNLAYITLHIGPGTFMPIRAENITQHKLEKEWFRVTKENAELINGTSGKLVAVGTTVIKALESAYKNGKLQACEGWSDLFIYPGYKFKSGISALLTNFHLPKSTVLLLTCAFAGRERILRAYKEAIKNGYRFYSFGDAMLIL